MQTGDETLDLQARIRTWSLRGDLEISWSWQTHLKATNFITSKKRPDNFFWKKTCFFQFFSQNGDSFVDVESKKAKILGIFFPKNFFSRSTLAGKIKTLVSTSTSKALKANEDETRDENVRSFHRKNFTLQTHSIRLVIVRILVGE